MQRVHQAMRGSMPTAAWAELERMDEVVRAWPTSLALWELFGVGGLGLRFAISADFTRGMGIALLLFAGDRHGWPGPSLSDSPVLRPGV